MISFLPPPKSIYYYTYINQTSAVSLDSISCLEL